MPFQSDPSTFWLSMTNAGLGVVVAVCLTALLWGVLLDAAVAVSRRLRRAAAQPDAHLFLVPGLGVTMADGGEVKEEEAGSGADR